MKKCISKKQFAPFIIALISCTSASAQKVTNEKLAGCWEIKSVEFLQPNDDSVDVRNGVKGMITCFERTGKFTAKMKVGGKMETIGTGTYSIRPDGKTIDQKRDADDNGVDESGEVVVLSPKRMNLKVMGIVLHYERL